MRFANCYRKNDMQRIKTLMNRKSRYIMIKTIKHFQDPFHGWYKVSRKLLRK